MRYFNQIVYVCAILLSFFFCEESIEFFESGETSGRGELQDRKREGDWIFYSCDGITIESEGHYKDGMKHDD